MTILVTGALNKNTHTRAICNLRALVIRVTTPLPIDWQLSVKSDFARDICEIAYKFGEPAPGAPGTLP